MPPVFALPVIEGGRTDAMFLAEILYRNARFVLFEDLDHHLGLCESTSFHVLEFMVNILFLTIAVLGTLTNGLERDKVNGLNDKVNRTCFLQRPRSYALNSNFEKDAKNNYDLWLSNRFIMKNIPFDAPICL